MKLGDDLPIQPPPKKSEAHAPEQTPNESNFEELLETSKERDSGYPLEEEYH